MLQIVNSLHSGTQENQAIVKSNITMATTDHWPWPQKIYYINVLQNNLEQLAATWKNLARR